MIVTDEATPFPIPKQSSRFFTSDPVKGLKFKIDDGMEFEFREIGSWPSAIKHLAADTAMAHWLKLAMGSTYDSGNADNPGVKEKAVEYAGKCREWEEKQIG